MGAEKGLSSVRRMRGTQNGICERSECVKSELEIPKHVLFDALAPCRQLERKIKFRVFLSFRRSG